MDPPLSSEVSMGQNSCGILVNCAQGGELHGTEGEHTRHRHRKLVASLPITLLERSNGSICLKGNFHEHFLVGDERFLHAYAALHLQNVCAIAGLHSASPPASTHR